MTQLSRARVLYEILATVNTQRERERDQKRRAGPNKIAGKVGWDKGKDLSFLPFIGGDPVFSDALLCPINHCSFFVIVLSS